MHEYKNDKGISHAHGKLKFFLRLALVDSIKKFDPRSMFKNPVMFVIYVYTIYMIFLVSFPFLFKDVIITTIKEKYYIEITLILIATIWFANLAESIAEAEGKTQADALKKMKKEIKAILVDPTTKKETIVMSSQLKVGDIVKLEDGWVVPKDGEIIEGSAMVDESMITGESQPVLREFGGDRTSVTGGTVINSGKILVKITEKPGTSFLDSIISLIESSSRQKTMNELSLTLFLSVMTFIILFVVLSLVYIEYALKLPIGLGSMIALVVCLAPTTIGGLLSAIGISGITRVSKVNVVTKSGKAVEAAGDIDVIILDKTGTITVGNRIATDIIPSSNVPLEKVLYAALICSVNDQTPEGKSIVKYVTRKGIKVKGKDLQNVKDIKFSPQTKYSGVILENGDEIIKGSIDTMIKNTKSFPSEILNESRKVGDTGATPLIIAWNKEVIGLVVLKDLVKPGIRQRIQELRTMGIKTVMCTGDNRNTAAAIAKDAGVDTFIAEAKPEDKLKLTKKYQKEGLLVAMTGDGTNDSPALSQADVGLAMNSGTQPAKDAANMVDLDSDPTKLIEVIAIGKQLLITRGALTTFSITNDVAKYFAILPAMFYLIGNLEMLNLMHLSTPHNAILSAVIFNAIVIPMLIPLAIKGISYMPLSPTTLLRQNVVLYGFGGILFAFVGIKIIDIIISTGSIAHVIGVAYFVIKTILSLFGVHI
ncbi:MAG: potassium-transporting ATPase subunit KdpB [Thermoplasmata archaeon]